MYSLITREDTIRIPAEYIRAGRKLEEHIDELAHDAFEGRFDGEGRNWTSSSSSARLRFGAEAMICTSSSLDSISMASSRCRGADGPG